MSYFIVFILIWDCKLLSVFLCIILKTGSVTFDDLGIHSSFLWNYLLTSSCNCACACVCKYIANAETFFLQMFLQPCKILHKDSHL
jgi:hypothetical protein